MTSPAYRQDCTKDCTTDCGWCKGDPLGALKRRIMRSLRWSRDAHGGIAFEDKATWRYGYDEAKRAVMREIYPRPGSAPTECCDPLGIQCEDPCDYSGLFDYSDDATDQNAPSVPR